MSTSIEVKLWGTTVGYLGYEEGSNIAVFEYDDAFMKSNILISPLNMKYPPSRHTFLNTSFNTFKGVPGIFTDSLPDKFGNQLIDQFMAEKNIAPDNITTLDRLLYVGNRAMGAIEYHPYKLNNESNKNVALDMPLLSELADLVVNNKGDLQKELKNTNTREDALNLIRVGSSAGGARSKALVTRKADGLLYDGTILYNENCSYWLLKFDSESNKDRDHGDPKGMTRVEYIYSLIASQCDINMPNTDYIEHASDFYFLIERFDRVVKDKKTTKLHYISWAGAAHFDRDTTGAYSYEQLIMTMRSMGLGQDDVNEVFKRAVFNIVGRNQDDHTKNFGFLMNKKGVWKLSPAFDLTYAYDPSGKWTKVHQIKLNRKQDNFTEKDIVAFGKYCNITEKTSLDILENTIIEFLKFEDLATQYDVSKDLKDTVLSNLRLKF